MALEMEWRFLVTKLRAIPPFEADEIRQAYLSAGDIAVRVRLRCGKGTLTIKGPAPSRKRKGPGPLVRAEYEYEIPPKDARELIAMSALRVEKRRYTLPGGLELDVFEGRHRGLVLAELEVTTDGPPPSPPEGWEWTDVTSDPRYTNRQLAESGLPPGCPLIEGV